MNTKAISTFLLLTSALAVQVLPNRAHAVAYCALRDPVDAIQNFYPAYTGYRSLVGSIDQEVRRALKSNIPHHIHFNEFGKHTLYVVISNNTAVGLVHARTEKGDWGLDEIIWSLDTELSIQDFRYQRSRSKYKEDVSTQEFKSLLRGRSLEELTDLLSADGTSLALSVRDLPKEAESLAVTVILSAMKTIMVTELVWGKDLSLLKSSYNSDTAAPRQSSSNLP